MDSKDLVVGNLVDKDNAKTNPIYKLLIDGFDKKFLEYLNKSKPRSVFEIGCGEGRLAKLIHQESNFSNEFGVVAYKGIDISQDLIQICQKKFSQNSNFLFEFKHAEEINFTKQFDTIVCCEVLEHLEDPGLVLKKIKKACKNYLLASVPNEPIWRFLNCLRGAYWRDFGNTPGHIQHWSSKRFYDLISTEFDIICKSTPLPWTMVLATPKN